MKKKLLWAGLLVFGLIVIVLGVVWANLNGIVRTTVQTQASGSLNVPTTLGGANVSLFGGSVGLTDLKIGSPQGFTAPEIFTLGDVGVKTSVGQLRSRPLQVSEITIDRPKLVIEQAGGKFNFKAFIDNLPATEPKEPSAGEPIKLIIDKLTVNGTQVVIRPGLEGIPGAASLPKEINLTIPSIELLKIGTGEGNQNGAAIKDVVGKVMTALVAKVADSDQLPPELRQLMKLDVSQLAAKVGAEVQKQIGVVTEDLSKAATQAISDPSKLKGTEKDLKNVGKNLGEGLKDALGQGKKEDGGTKATTKKK